MKDIKENTEEIFNDLKEILNLDNIYINHELKKYTSFKIGGKGKIFIEITDVDNLIKIMKYIKENDIKYFILGSGTNIVFPSSGFNGIVIKINIDSIEVLKEKDYEKHNIKSYNSEDIYVKAGAGLKLSEMIKTLAEDGIGDLANIYGIPGSVGGAIKMNAGAFGTEIKDILYSAIFLDDNLDICEYGNEKLNLDYRKSIFKDEKHIILYGIFKLKKVNKEKHIEEMQSIMQRRIDKQPLDYPSAGSTFKRGDGFITSMLLDNLGLKGFKVGGAMVSTKHAGFVINYDNATSDDVKNIVEEIKKIVKEKENKNLETEIIFVDGE